jgi:hypothetical protein
MEREACRTDRGVGSECNVRTDCTQRSADLAPFFVPSLTKVSGLKIIDLCALRTTSYAAFAKNVSWLKLSPL